MSRWAFLAVVLLAGCASMSRDCSNMGATSFGADWVVVQTDLNGHAFRCWELHGAAITNEGNSDGIWWEDPQSRNLVHISGSYTRVQVINGSWESAFRAVGLTAERCRAIRMTVAE